MEKNPGSGLDILSADTNALSAKSFIMKQASKTDTLPVIGQKLMFNGLALLICLEGRVSVRVNYRMFEIRKNQILVILPSQIISVAGNVDPARTAGLFIGKDHLSVSPVTTIDFDAMVDLGKNPLVNLTDEEMDDLMELYSVLLKRHRKLKQPYNEICFGSLLFSFLAEIAAIYDKNKPLLVKAEVNRRNKISDEFFRLLLGNFKEQRSVTFYADKLCLSPKYLSRVVKQTTGHTIHDWINEIVIIHIKNLLKTTDKTVLEISEEMNFSNPSFFGRYFKQYTAMTPRQFRIKG